MTTVLTREAGEIPDAQRRRGGEAGRRPCEGEAGIAATDRSHGATTKGHQQPPDLGLLAPKLRGSTFLLFWPPGVVVLHSSSHRRPTSASPRPGSPELFQQLLPHS